MANYEATRYDWDGQYLTSVQGINTGLIIPWGSASIPSGFLECNGQSISTSTYAALFAVIGYTYGGSGASFNLPDLTDRTVVNKSNTKTLAQTGGANTVAKSGTINSATAGSTTLLSAEMPSHGHMQTLSPGASTAQPMSGGCDSPISGANSGTSGSTGGGGSHNHSVTANFAGGSDSVLQPYIVMVYIIKT